ncbi:ubiquitin-2 like Rad60 SUMO-like-domain-containing protein [Chlamydoabsidia padenii]|nr:ubiquitin-2 like Rad60 SUMO-like-domain-containing protein [Chlamydoabsidia padenii]
MCDFDITSFREKTSIVNKAESTKEESAYALFLKKRKQLGLDESDSEDDDDNDNANRNPVTTDKKQRLEQRPETAKPTNTNDHQKTLVNDISAAGLRPEVNDQYDNLATQLLQHSSHNDIKTPIVLIDDPVLVERKDKTTTTHIQTKQRFDYDTSLDIEDLDPELASLATEAEEKHPASSSSSGSIDTSSSPKVVPKRIEIKVSYVSLLETVDPVVQGVINALSKPVKIIMLDNNRFDILLAQYCKKKRLLMADMVLVYENVPVLLRATPSSLSMSAESTNRMEVYKRDDFEKKTKLEQEIRTARLSHLNDLTGDDDGDDDDDIDYSTNEQNEQQEEDLLHIKLRGKNNKDIGLRVKQTTTIESIVKEYHRLMELDAALLNKIQLSFEGEILAGTMTIAETELEDEDMVSVIIHS